jgi:alkanesulfonate monooxygenase SsuD/methylene tetrahydromethanopterin reductase-like flavin-dependent oxidoreductase (luciferase family)
MWQVASTLVSTLEVLSKGRAWFGIGAAWNSAEAAGLGLPFPSEREGGAAGRRSR